MKRGCCKTLSGKLATSAWPTLFSVWRLRISPKAPSASCWQISTTERWKKEPCNFPPSRIICPCNDVFVSGMFFLLGRLLEEVLGRLHKAGGGQPVFLVKLLRHPGRLAEFSVYAQRGHA